MAERLVCPHCNLEFANRLDKYRHLDKWGCPVYYAALTAYAAPFCACGCHEKVETAKRHPKKYNKFIRGHNRPKGDKINGKQSYNDSK